jgi:hypothetical protein
MKNNIKFLTLLTLVFSFTFTSCDKDLLNVEFDTTAKATIVAHVDQGQETINESVVLSIDNSDTNKYLSNINDVKIKKLTYKIISFSGDEVGTIDVDFYADTIILITDQFVVKEAFEALIILEVTDISKLNAMASLLQDNLSITVGISGISSALQDEMDFNIEITAELEITASPL